MNRTIEQVEAEAGKKIPRDEVSQREGGGGKKLSYLEAQYVIQRMNTVFGVCGWDSETVEMKEVTAPNGKPSYISKVRLTVIVKTEDGGYMKSVKEGYGFGSDKSSLNPHEMAIKEAESDAFKRAARQFGMSLGLALYSKDQENVEEAPPKTTENNQKPVATPTVNNRETVNKKITAISRVVIAKKLKTLDELKAEIKTKYGVDQATALSDNFALELLSNLERMAEGKSNEQQTTSVK